ncbi:MAG: integrase, partial [Maribacter sp.]|nr:integrase [Maribacter sp.]
MKIIIKLIRNILAKFNLIANLTVNNLALHQQLIVLNRSIKRPQIKTKDRLFWIILYLFWNNWQESLIVLKPETVVGWHKKGFRLFWEWKGRSKSTGPPRINQEMTGVISSVTVAKPLWGGPRIHG